MKKFNTQDLEPFGQGFFKSIGGVVEDINPTYFLFYSIEGRPAFISYGGSLDGGDLTAMVFLRGAWTALRSLAINLGKSPTLVRLKPDQYTALKSGPIKVYEPGDDEETR